MKRAYGGKKKRSEYIFIISMIFIPISNFLLFWLYTNFNSILYAFQTVDVYGNIHWGFENFRLFFDEFATSNAPIAEAFRNTMIFFLSGLLITLPVSFLMCYFIFKKIFMHKFFRAVFYLPSIVSSAVLVILFKYIISAKGPVGVLTNHLGWGYIPFLTSSDYALKTILFYTIFTSFGGNIVLFSGAMTQIDKDILDAGKVDGVGLIGEMIYIIIPMIWPTLSTMILFQFVNIFGASGPILLFTQGSYGTRTISFYIYMLVYEGTSYYYPAAIGLIFTAIATPIALGMRALMNKLDNGVS